MSSLCERIKKMKKELEVILLKKKEGTFTNQDMLDFIKSNNLNFKNDVNIAQQNVCLNLASSFSQQFAGVKDSCIRKIENICNSTYNNQIDYDNCYQKLMPKLQNITQANESEIIQNCEITSLLNSDLTKANEDLALTLNMILGKFEPDCAKLTELNIKADVEKFTKELNLCINLAISNQKNVIEGCYMNNIDQSNFSKIYQNCIIKNNNGPMQETVNIQQNETNTIPTSLKIKPMEPATPSAQTKVTTQIQPIKTPTSTLEPSSESKESTILGIQPLWISIGGGILFLCCITCLFLIIRRK